ncbi:MAG: NAD-dependent epimerase/dehydratase family protein [Janthinobacterium lividum]
MTQDLAGVRVLVVGASGFLGGRLVERLVVEHGARVRVLVRRVMGAASLARLPIEVVVGDVLDPVVVEAAAEGCAVIFNCAKGKGSDPALRRAVEVDGVQHLVRAAGRNSARLVQVSTMAVYDLHRHGVLDESSPAAPRGDAYADAKLEGERAALQLGAQLGVPVVVIQPTVVYGPNAGVHGTEILEELTTGRVVLVNGGTGVCNAVYVDDVVTALQSAATAERAPGERFLVTGPGHPTWAEFFAAFEAMLGVQRTVGLSEAEAVTLWRRSRRRPWLLSEALRAAGEDRALRARLLGTKEGALARQAVRRVHSLRPPAVPARSAPSAQTSTISEVELELQAPRPWLARYLASKPTVSNAKAHDLLGYQPAFGLEHGMHLTEQWARWVGLLP